MTVHCNQPDGSLDKWMCDGTYTTRFVWENVQDAFYFEESWMSSASSSIKSFALGSTGYFVNYASFQPYHSVIYRTQRPVLHEFVKH